MKKVFSLILFLFFISIAHPQAILKGSVEQPQSQSQVGFKTKTSTQVDTLNPSNGKLNMAAFIARKSSYAVFFEDTTGTRISTADIWDREVGFTMAAGKRAYNFKWRWYRRDSLLATITAQGEMPSLYPLSHQGDYVRRGKISYQFNNNLVTVPQADRHNRRDSLFRVILSPPAFEFPMDLEILPLVPFKKTGQQFAIAFYEPGSPKSDYYLLTVTGKEYLEISGGLKLNCWLLRIDYGRGGYATFWISDKTREVIKMKEYFAGKYRYKVKLY